MSQLYLKGVYYDTESEGFWFLNNSGTYEEISISGGTTIYTGDGSLSGPREIDLDGNTLEILHDFGGSIGEQYFIQIDPINGSTKIQGFNAGTEFGNAGQGYFTSSGTQGQFLLEAYFNGESTVAGIVGTADVGGSTIRYDATTHTFSRGDVILADLAGGGTTGASIDDTGKIIRTP